MKQTSWFYCPEWQAKQCCKQQIEQNSTLKSLIILNGFVCRDVEDTAERIAKKAALFSSTERGRELSAAQELKRKHLARVAEATAVWEKIQQLETDGHTLAHKWVSIHLDEKWWLPSITSIVNVAMVLSLLQWENIHDQNQFRKVLLVQFRNRSCRESNPRLIILSIYVN